MEEFSAAAFVLRSRAYGESDLIAVVLTKEEGKISAIAKGARRSRKRFAGGALEPFRELRLRITRKPYSSLALIHESRIVAPNQHIAADLEAFGWASYLSELTDAMIPERDPCPGIYALYRDVIRRLENENAEALGHHYILGLLDHSGWAPDFNVCRICAEEVGEYSKPILDHRGGGIICSVHEAESRGIEAGDPNFRPSRRIIEAPLLDYVRSARNAVLEAPDPRTGELATALLNRLVDLHLGRELKSRAFLAHLSSIRQ